MKNLNSVRPLFGTGFSIISIVPSFCEGHSKAGKARRGECRREAERLYLDKKTKQTLVEFNVCTVFGSNFFLVHCAVFENLVFKSDRSDVDDIHVYGLNQSKYGFTHILYQRMGFGVITI